MTELFLKIVNMSITASVLVLLVLVLRLLLKKAPKWVNVLLWGLVAVRLICPWGIESSLSLMPKTEWGVQDTAYSEDELAFNSIPDSISVGDLSAIGKDITVTYYPTDPQIEVHRSFSVPFVLSCVWLVGMVAMLVYLAVSYLQIYRRIRSAKQFRDNIFTSDSVSSPFVFGVIKPRICMPENMDAVNMSYVIAHEEAHIGRKDHWWKPLGFLLLTLHWFNPVMWLSYILLCRDIEMACDERVVRDMGEIERADYSEALLECSVKRSMISACPLAFGEVGVKQRIKSVLNYKKPAFWIVVVAVVACIVAAICFLTNPIIIRNPWVQEYVVGADGILGQVDKAKYESVSTDFAVGADKHGRAVFKDPFAAFETMTELYSEGLALIAEEQELTPISQSNYNLYKKFGWQVTSGSEQAQEQARFVSGFLDIYENSFDKEKPNADLPAPTVEGEIGTETILAFNVTSETLSYEILKQHQEEIWAYRTTAINDTVDETFRKWGERIAAVGVNEEQNCVDVYVYDFDQGDIGRFQKALGHLSYVLIQKEDVIEMIPDNKKQLTLEEVIELSAKGTDLTWEDFAPYPWRDVGSGLYICRYEIDDIFHLLVGDGKLTGTPMYIRLKLNDGDAYADVTKDDVAAFIREHTSAKISVDSSVSVPQPVLDYALSLLQSHIDTYNGYGISQKAVTKGTYYV